MQRAVGKAHLTAHCPLAQSSIDDADAGAALTVALDEVVEIGSVGGLQPDAAMRSRVTEAAHILGPVNGKTARERTPNTASASCHICASNASASDISGGSCREGCNSPAWPSTPSRPHRARHRPLQSFAGLRYELQRRRLPRLSPHWRSTMRMQKPRQRNTQSQSQTLFEPLQHGAAPFGREPSQIIRHCSVEQVFASDLHANIAVVDDEIKQSREFQLMSPAIPDLIRNVYGRSDNVQGTLACVHRSMLGNTSTPASSLHFLQHLTSTLINPSTLVRFITAID